MVDNVPVAPLREAFLRSPLSRTELALALGWEHNGRPDGTRVERALGLVPTPVSPKDGGGSNIRQSVKYKTAVAICRALGLAPVDFDL